ncbi:MULTISPECIES: glycosyltransferase family 39 protein [Catenuloplanes]|uniref:Mannosyltransferase n=1 Tax=Catenuloplanes niger TaxID=587534 RepID=A0AAE3ZYR6_9ACTN|nr:glycosyltransferase family 39 protein [Catenuloplanes niger]MDR7326513.1 mannosyltransferase [Catenuloplanes niger]
MVLLVTASVSITGPGFSWDEVATADIARRTPAEIWALMRHVDGVLGPYYLLMHVWTGLAGTSETVLRLPQVVAMALAAGLTGELGRRLFTPLTGLTAGLLLVIMPNSYRYAAEARPYAFSVLFSALSLLLLHLALRRPDRWRWIPYGASVAFLGLSHIVGVSVLAAHAVIVLRRDRRLLRGWALTATVVLVLLAPLVVLGAGQQAGQVAWIKPLSAAILRRSPAEIVGSAAAAWLLIGLVLAFTWRSRYIELVALCAAPMLALASYSLLVGPLWVPRYLLVVLPPLALLAAAIVCAPHPSPPPPSSPSPSAAPPRSPAAASAPSPSSPAPSAAPPPSLAPPVPSRSARLGTRWPRGRAWLPVAVTLAVLFAAAWPEHRQQRGALAKNGADYRALTRMIAARDRPGDAIIYQDNNRALRAGVDFYYRGDPDRPADVLLARTAGQAGRLTAVEHPDVATHLRDVPRVWFVVAATGPEDPLIHKPRAALALRTGFRRTDLFTVHGATVALYRRVG